MKHAVGMLDTSTVLRIAELDAGDLPVESVICTMTPAELSAGPLVAEDAATAKAGRLPVYTFNAGDFEGSAGLDGRAAAGGLRRFSPLPDGRLTRSGTLRSSTHPRGRQASTRSVSFGWLRAEDPEAS